MRLSIQMARAAGSSPQAAPLPFRAPAPTQLLVVLENRHRRPEADAILEDAHAAPNFASAAADFILAHRNFCWACGPGALASSAFSRPNLRLSKQTLYQSVARSSRQPVSRRFWKLLEI